MKLFSKENKKNTNLVLTETGDYSEIEKQSKRLVT
jgi:hypothetical protein